MNRTWANGPFQGPILILSRNIPKKVWLGKLTMLDMTQLGWLGHKISTQTNTGWSKSSLGSHFSMFSDLALQILWWYMFHTSGCDVKFNNTYGTLFTPGYMGNIYYPQNIICTWTIEVDRPISIYFEQDLSLDDSFTCIKKSNDYLQVCIASNTRNWHNGSIGRASALWPGGCGFNTWRSY